MINFETNNKEVEKMTRAEDLIAHKILSFGKNAKDNPENLNFPTFCLGIANEDYPAQTPLMWNAAYKRFRLPTRNVRLFGDPKNLPEILQIFKNDPRYLGGDVGVGFKDKAVELVDEIDPLAKMMQSINVMVKVSEDRLKGYNTDGLGYAQSLENVFRQKKQKLNGKKAVILGSGGTGNAIAFALAQKGMRLIILNRTIAKAQVLAQRINEAMNLQGAEKVCFAGEEQIPSEVTDADVVINVSTKGAAGEMKEYNALAVAKLPVKPEYIDENWYLAERTLKLIPKKTIMSDVVLTKEPTPFLRLAKTHGYQILDGFPMVLNQGIEAFWLVNEKVLKAKGITKSEIAKVMSKATGIKI
jgi:shikimate dehydrogenase